MRLCRTSRRKADIFSGRQERPPYPVCYLCRRHPQTANPMAATSSNAKVPGSGTTLNITSLPLADKDKVAGRPATEPVRLVPKLPVMAPASMSV